MIELIFIVNFIKIDLCRKLKSKSIKTFLFKI